MRKSLSFLVLNLLLGSAACEISTGDGEEEGDTRTGEGTGDGTKDGGTRVPPTSTPGTGGNDAATPIADAGPSTVTPGGDAGAPGDAGTPPAPPPPGNGGTTQPPEQCALPLPTASATCGGPDVFEPNQSKATAIDVTAASGCAVVPGKMSSGDDEDWYLFTSPKADPVQIELAYETTATGAGKLAYQLFEATSTSYILWQSGREDLAWTLSNAAVVKKNIGYTVRVWDEGNLQSCQGYNLRIDPQFCTDAFEDNDSRSAPSKGLTLGTMASATVFSGDEDWYDVSAFQANGATCTLSAEIAVTQVSEVEIQTFGAGTSGYLQWKEVNGNATSTTFTLPAGSTSLFRVWKSGGGCTKYTLLCNPL